MISPAVQVRLDKKNSPSTVTHKAAVRGVDLTAMELKGNLQRNSPVDEGKMQGSWLIRRGGGLTRKLFSSAAYTPYVNYGTGLYGPRGQKIRPKSARLLSFKYNGRKIAVPWTRGMKPRRFVEKSISQTRRRIPEFIIRAVKETGG